MKEELEVIRTKKKNRRRIVEYQCARGCRLPAVDPIPLSFSNRISTPLTTKCQELG